MGLNAVITRRAAEGRVPDHRGPPRHPRPRAGSGGRRRGRATRRGGGSFGDAARPLVPRYLRRGIAERLLADGSVHLPLDEEQARGQLEVLERCAVEGVAICLLNAYVDPAHERRLRELPREVLGDDVAVSISSETSPLAKEYARASTTVVDVFMKLIFTGYAHPLDERLRETRLHRRAELRRLRGDAAPVGGGARAAVPDRVRRPGGRDDVQPAPRRGARRAQPRLLRRRRDVHRRLARRRRPAVRRQHVRARARPDHQRALDGDLERRRRRRQHRLDLAVRRRRSSGRRARAPTRARPATAAAARSRRSPTPRC